MSALSAGQVVPLSALRMTLDTRDKPRVDIPLRLSIVVAGIGSALSDVR